jgi:hypothetical protein
MSRARMGCRRAPNAMMMNSRPRERRNPRDLWRCWKIRPASRQPQRSAPPASRSRRRGSSRNTTAGAPRVISLHPHVRTGPTPNCVRRPRAGVKEGGPAAAIWPASSGDKEPGHTRSPWAGTAARRAHSRKGPTSIIPWRAELAVTLGGMGSVTAKRSPMESSAQPQW